MKIKDYFFGLEPLVRFERTTYWLQVSCSTSWAKVAHFIELFGSPYGNRTHVPAVKGRCLNLLTKGPNKHEHLFKTDIHMVSYPRLERGTTWLKVKCSTTWANSPSFVLQSVSRLPLYITLFFVGCQQFYYIFFNS